MLSWCGSYHSLLMVRISLSLAQCPSPWYLPTTQSPREASSELSVAPKPGWNPVDKCGCLAWSSTIGLLLCGLALEGLDVLGSLEVLSVFTLILLMNNAICYSFLASSSAGA